MDTQPHEESTGGTGQAARAGCWLHFRSLRSRGLLSHAGPCWQHRSVSVSYSALRMEQASPLCPPPHFPSDSFTTCPPVLSLPPRPSAPRVGQRSQAFRAVVVQLPNHCRQLFPGPTGSVGMLVASGSHHFAGSLVHFPTAPTVKTHQPHPLG